MRTRKFIENWARSAHLLTSLLGYADGKGGAFQPKCRKYNVHVNVSPAIPLPFHRWLTVGLRCEDENARDTKFCEHFFIRWSLDRGDDAMMRTHPSTIEMNSHHNTTSSIRKKSRMPPVRVDSPPRPIAPETRSGALVWGTAAPHETSNEVTSASRSYQHHQPVHLPSKFPKLPPSDGDCTV